MKNLVKSLCPPILISLFRYLRGNHLENTFKGEFSTWSEAQSQSGGYDTQAVFEKVHEAALKVHRGEALFERDSVIFDEIQYSWPVLCGLLIAVASKKSLSILDFGGALGSSYYQNKKSLYYAGIEKLNWSIIEQTQFVKCGQSEFSGGDLHFYEDIESCLKEQEKVDVILCSSVLPYLENPLELAKRLAQIQAEYIIIDRTPVLNSAKMTSRLTCQYVPSTIYKASYPAWFFSESELLGVFNGRYELIYSFDALGGEVLLTKPSAKAFYKGYIFRAKK